MRTGNVSVAAPTSLAASWLPPLLADFRRDYPGVGLRLDDPVAERRMSMLLNNEVDLVLNADAGNPQEFESRFVLKESFYVIMRRADPLAGRDQVNVKDLKGRSFVHTVRGGSVWPQIYPFLKQAGVQDAGFAVSSFSTLGALVGAGFGISIVPRSAIPLCLGPDLAHALLAARSAARPLYLIKRKNRSLSAAAQALWQRILDTLPGVAAQPG
jgi:LysR family carnitine catabolism transcriptional activator